MTRVKYPKLEPGDRVEIIWCDTNIPNEPGWMREDEHREFAENHGDVVRSVGIYVSKNKTFIHLVGDTEAEEVLERSFLRAINIARPFIREIYKLRRV